MTLRAFLGEASQKFRSQAHMLDHIERETGVRFSSGAMSMWLKGERYPDPRSRQVIKDAFKVSDRKWWGIMKADMMGETSDSSARKTAVA